MAIEATVHWRGVSYSGGGSRDHAYWMKFESLPRVGETVEICGQDFRVGKIRHDAGHVEIEAHDH